MKCHIRSIKARPQSQGNNDFVTLKSRLSVQFGAIFLCERFLFSVEHFCLLWNIFCSILNKFCSRTFFVSFVPFLPSLIPNFKSIGKVLKPGCQLKKFKKRCKGKILIEKMTESFQNVFCLVVRNTEIMPIGLCVVFWKSSRDPEGSKNKIVTFLPSISYRLFVKFLSRFVEFWRVSVEILPSFLVIKVC